MRYSLRFLLSVAAVVFWTLSPLSAVALERLQPARAPALNAVLGPTLTSPADGTTLNNFGPTLSWTNPPATQQVHLQIIPANNDGPGADLYFGSNVSSFQVPPPPQWYGLLPGMSYTWRARVSDALSPVGLDDLSWSDWSSRTFRTPSVNSASIRLAAPAVDASLGTLMPTLEWNSTRSDVFYYEVQLSKDATFNTNPATAMAMVYWGLVHGGVTSPANSYAVPAGSPLEDNTTYHWRVRPRVQGDGSPVAWTPAASFRTQVSSPSFPPQGIDRVVLGQYYAWYDTDTWTSGYTADTPTIQYSSDDLATIRRHVQQAKQAGLDALALSWQGPGDRTDSNLQKLLAESAAQGLWVTITFETDKPQFDTVGKVLNGLRNIHSVAASRPNWLRSQGKPVFLFWRPQTYSLGTWAEIRAQVDPNHEALWMMEGLDWDLLDVFDGQFGYSIAWSGNVRNTLASWATRVANKAAQLGQPKIFMGTVMPGYDDIRTGRPDGFARDRENGAYLAQTWDAAIAAGAQWVNLTSFNEWIEGSQIEPSVTYGDQYLNINKEWSAGFKG